MKTTAREEATSWCITCGAEIHPERAQKYNYCTARECREQNAKGVTIVAVGLNKAAEQFQLLDDDTRNEMASGKYHDQRRATFGPPPRRPTGAASSSEGTPAKPTPKRAQPASRRPPWTRSQQRLALLYNEQGMRPDEIARKLRLSRYVVTQIILAAKNRGKS